MRSLTLLLIALVCPSIGQANQIVGYEYTFDPPYAEDTVWTRVLLTSPVHEANLDLNLDLREEPVGLARLHLRVLSNSTVFEEQVGPIFTHSLVITDDAFRNAGTTLPAFDLPNDEASNVDGAAIYETTYDTTGLEPGIHHLPVRVEDVTGVPTDAYLYSFVISPSHSESRVITDLPVVDLRYEDASPDIDGSFLWEKTIDLTDTRAGALTLGVRIENAEGDFSEPTLFSIISNPFHPDPAQLRVAEISYEITPADETTVLRRGRFEAEPPASEVVFDFRATDPTYPLDTSAIYEVTAWAVSVLGQRGEPMTRTFTYEAPDLTAYNTWLATFLTLEQIANPEFSDPRADPDQDGRSQIVEFGHQTNGLLNEQVMEIEMVQVSTDTWRVAILQPQNGTGIPGVSYLKDGLRFALEVAEGSLEERDWMIPQPAPVIISRTPVDSTLELVILELNLPNVDRAFARLRYNFF